MALLGRFCLLEQILPNGPEHPFAKTMLAHFEKLNTPLRAASKYPTTEDQEVRFRNSGWKNVQVLNLWELWGCPDFLTSAQRIALDDVEPFDEWEEFSLFASHYFLLTANNAVPRTHPFSVTFPHKQTESLHSEDIMAQMTYAGYQKSHGCRRFGASLPIRGVDRKRDLIGDFGGMGPKTRLSSYDTYVPSLIPDRLFHNFHSLEMPSARMCHTITDLGDAGALLVGGRSSPDKGLTDCWLHHKWTNTWERVDDLPISRYRHSAVAIGAGSVLIAGGKSNSRTILKDFSLWSRRRGWVECTTNIIAENTAEFRSRGFGAHSDEEPAIFGGMLGVFGTNSSNAQTVTGILAGGMAQDGLISENVWIWTLQGYDEKVSFLRIQP
jgi:tRNA wybutosine-synthesizing protein 4